MVVMLRFHGWTVESNATGRVRLRPARVSAVDPQRRTVTVTLEDGDGELAHDTLSPRSAAP
ncbi:hypothetical protein [Streptomyces sp. NPDC090036]|uniref:hypothetical protein n=1 Tax=Streptomyces sp. NPDC090036 TaxID=3365926 RepID=UPI003807CFCA